MAIAGEHRSTEKQENRSTGAQEHMSKGAQEYWTTGLQNYRSTGVQEYTSTLVHDYTSTRVHEYRSSGDQKLRSTGVQEFRSTGVLLGMWEFTVLTEINITNRAFLHLRSSKKGCHRTAGFEYLAGFSGPAHRVVIIQTFCCVIGTINQINLFKRAYLCCTKTE